MFSITKGNKLIILNTLRQAIQTETANIIQSVNKAANISEQNADPFIVQGGSINYEVILYDHSNKSYFCSGYTEWLYLEPVEVYERHTFEVRIK